MGILRRFPALAWLPVYIGSLLILNGAHGKFDPLELGAGIALVLIACAAGLYLAFAPWPDDRPRPRLVSSFIWLVVAFYVLCALAAWIFTGGAEAIAALLAGLIPLTAAAIWVASVRRGSVAGDDGLVDATRDDSESAFPAMGADDGRPLGDTPAAHDEIVPEDLPKDHPGRTAAEEQAAARNGTTPGHREGGAAGSDHEPARSDEPLVDQRFEGRGAKVRR